MNKNKIWIVIILILLVLIAVGGFFLAKKLESKENKKEESYEKVINFRGKDKIPEEYEYTLVNGEYKYTFKSTEDGGISVNGKKIEYSEDFGIEAFGILDNGMIVLNCFHYTIQYGNIRYYYDSNLNLVKKVEGVPFNTEVLAREYKFNTTPQECINNSYSLYKIYEIKIGEKDINEELVSTERQEGCAGVV